ncbi:cache domain-containing sensor histidine kinase [Kineothrix sedimenti]|uniref:histidine kinase n=1 Tax=Kineothrix sedimenti TaxID=3123317 RepID=A0ABZ3EWL0_9FIRM
MKIKMRMKILILCLGSTLIALVLQTILFQRVSGNLIYNQAKSENYNMMQNMQNEIYTFVKKIESGLIEIYNDKEFLQELKGTERIEEIRENNYRIAYDQAMENFSTTDNIVALYIYNSSHEIISTYRRAVTPKHNYPKDIYEDEEMYNADKVKKYVASDNKYMFLSSYYNVYRETDIARFVLKIYDNVNTNDIIGYVVCDIDSKAFVKIMEKYTAHQEVYMWLQPLGDRPITAMENTETASREYYLEISERIQNNTLDMFMDTSEGNKVLFQVPQNKYNLGAYSIMPQAILEQNQKALTQNLILIGSMMCIILSVVTFFISRTLTKPLEELMKTIAQIRKGDTKKRVPYLEKDEIGQLGKEFNGMLDEIERLIGHEYETKLLLNKAEYKALQAQINPHFLYNTLDTMSSIASVQNCDMVSNLCQSLSTIFRYSLDTKHPYSTVAKEIVHLKNYIYVMNVRMREEVKYHFQIDDEILQNSIPRISIQPLVENAINHGLRNKKGEKEIYVRVMEKDGILEIEVEDNGVGMDAEETNRRLKENSHELVESGSSIGLININARMKMLYGEEYGLHINSDGKSGTTVILRIPRMGVEEAEAWLK